MLHYCANLKAIRYESTSLNRIVADKSHTVIVAYLNDEDTPYIPGMSRSSELPNGKNLSIEDV